MNQQAEKAKEKEDAMSQQIHTFLKRYSSRFSLMCIF